MTEYVYPVPSDAHQLGELLNPFLEETVSEKGLTPNQQFMVVLFGEDASETTDEAVEIIENTEPTARKSYDINQLSVVSVDERRLNTFTTSLLYALLETDPDQPLEETVTGDYIADEDERKVDYYLPRLIETMQTLLEEHSERFEENLADLFPVDLDTPDVRDMNERLEKDVVTDQVILDFLLLAAGSTEDENGVESLLRYIREEKIDQSEMLSGGSGGVAGYSRIIKISYLINKDSYNSEFRTARNLYNRSATSSLLRLLDETADIPIETGVTDEDSDDSEDDAGEDTPLETFYSSEQRVERLVTSQFQGNTTKIAERLLRAINGTRLIQNNSDTVNSTYQSQKESIESEIKQLHGELTSLEAHADEFEDTKIQVDTGRADPYEKLVRLVDETNSLIIRFLFGFDRAVRTSVFTTLEYNLKQYRETLFNHRTRVDELLEEIEALESRCQREVEELLDLYERLEATGVEVDVPDQATMTENLEEAWDEEIVQLRHELPEIDFTDEDGSPQSKLDEWDSQISECRKRLESLCEPIEQFGGTVDKLEQMGQKRNSVQNTLIEIDGLMEEQ